MRIVGKFGPNLLSEPGTMYEIIPALCPVNSAMHQQFHYPNARKMKILGSNQSTWSERLARLLLPEEASAWSISCAGKHIAVLSSTGAVHIWDALNFAQISTITHGEPVSAITLDGSGSELATFWAEKHQVVVSSRGQGIGVDSQPTTREGERHSVRQRRREALGRW